jgi:hypothetical protein
VVVEGGEEWLTMAEMARRHVEMGLGPMSRQRLWELARKDPNWPVAPERTRRAGRYPVFPWSVMEPYLRTRERRQGERTDLRRRQGEEREMPD